MVKVTVEIPDTWLKFRNAYEKWANGKKLDVEDYLKECVKSDLGAYMEDMHIENPRELEKLVWDLGLYEIYPSKWALHAQNPIDKGVLKKTDEQAFLEGTKTIRRTPLPIE